MEQTVAWMRMAALVRRRAQRKERKLMTVRWIVSVGGEKEAKKEAFRKYLEFNGVIDSLTKGDIDNMGAEINVTLISEARGSSTILWCESGPFEDIQNRIHDAVEEFAITASSNRTSDMQTDVSSAIEPKSNFQIDGSSTPMESKGQTPTSIDRMSATDTDGYSVIERNSTTQTDGESPIRMKPNGKSPTPPR
ncbi:hypothetical protein DY000_02018952 [Brassica cretica]|uniref:Uncharacterized protein n=1 Tax=Brassica cretica TaxID=69181 RepID=A0ABQ7D528_BRACR|nr:hypothetical protein DY000_02018952 [Brassica cretica]